MGIKAKIDDGKKSKVAKKTTRRQTKRSSKQEEKVEDIYKFIRKEKDKIFLKDEVIKEFDTQTLKGKDIDNELMLFELKKESYEKDVALMEAKIELLKRDKRDVETAIFHKKTEKKNLRTLQSEYRFKIGKELGEKVTSFGYNPDTYEVVLDT